MCQCQLKFCHDYAKNVFLRNKHFVQTFATHFSLWKNYDLLNELVPGTTQVF